MHETGRAQSILRTVLEIAQEKNIPSIKRVEVLINPAAGVDEEELLEILDELKENTFLKETTFELKDAGMEATCKKCGTVFPVNSPSDVCPNCQSADFELAVIDDWKIASVE